MSNPVNLEISSINLNSIIMSLVPPVMDLTKTDLDIYLNGSEFSKYNIIDESRGQGKVYNIVPYNNFFPYDTVDLQILKEGSESDKVKVIFAKAFNNSTAEIDFKLPENEQGNYVIKLMSVNGIEFNISSNPIVVSNFIDSNLSSASINEERVHFLDEDINIYIKLFDVYSDEVLDGLYEIEVEVEK